MPKARPHPNTLTSESEYRVWPRPSRPSARRLHASRVLIVRSTPSGPHTTHFSILDAAGNRVAATLSLNLYMGSGFMVPKTGVMLNNTMDDFSIKQATQNVFGLVGGTANEIAPNKRSLSSMTPTFVETRAGVMIAGSPGGSYIINMVLLGTLNYLDGMGAAEIVRYPRYHHQYLPDVVDYEKGALSEDEIRALQAEGHTLQESSRQWGNMQVITWDYATGHVEAASEPRGAGEGLVY